jgi:hypothetical protein
LYYAELAVLLSYIPSTFLLPLFLSRSQGSWGKDSAKWQKTEVPETVCGAAAVSHGLQ